MTPRLSMKSRELHCPLCDRLVHGDDNELIPVHMVPGRARDRPLCEASGWYVEPHEWLWP